MKNIIIVILLMFVIPVFSADLKNPYNGKSYKNYEIVVVVYRYTWKEGYNICGVTDKVYCIDKTEVIENNVMDTRKYKRDINDYECFGKSITIEISHDAGATMLPFRCLPDNVIRGLKLPKMMVLPDDFDAVKMKEKMAKRNKDNEILKQQFFKKEITMAEFKEKINKTSGEYSKLQQDLEIYRILQLQKQPLGYNL